MEAYLIIIFWIIKGWQGIMTMRTLFRMNAARMPGPGQEGK